MGLFHHLHLVGALHQLVDLRGHARLGDLQQRGRLDLGGAVLQAADVKRRQPALVVGGHRHGLEHEVDLLGGQLLGQQALAGALGDQLLGARARGHAGGGDPHQTPGPVGERERAAVEGVDLLGLHPGHGRRLVLGVARRDRHLRAGGALAGANELGDVLGERLRAERGLAQDDLADGLVDDLVEARHVGALLHRAEVHEAVEAREEQLLADTHDLLDAGDADAREADRDRGGARLHVPAGSERGKRCRMRYARLHTRPSLAGAISRASGARESGPRESEPSATVSGRNAAGTGRREGRGWSCGCDGRTG